MTNIYNESLHWEEVILYLYNEYDTYEDIDFEKFKSMTKEKTTLDNDEDVEEVLDFLKSVNLIEYNDSVKHHPLTSKGFNVARDLEDRRTAEKRKSFEKSNQFVISVMTFFLGLGAVAQVATIYNLSEDMISGILTGTVIILLIGLLFINRESIF